MDCECLQQLPATNLSTVGVTLFRKAAEACVPQACFNLGDRDGTGTGVPQTRVSLLPGLTVPRSLALLWTRRVGLLCGTHATAGPETTPRLRRVSLLRTSPWGLRYALCLSSGRLIT